MPNNACLPKLITPNGIIVSASSVEMKSDDNSVQIVASMLPNGTFCIDFSSSGGNNNGTSGSGPFVVEPDVAIPNGLLVTDQTSGESFTIDFALIDFSSLTTQQMSDLNDFLKGELITDAFGVPQGYLLAL